MLGQRDVAQQGPGLGEGERLSGQQTHAFADQSTDVTVLFAAGDVGQQNHLGAPLRCHTLFFSYATTDPSGY